VNTIDATDYEIRNIKYSNETKLADAILVSSKNGNTEETIGYLGLLMMV
jgi:hypothetical protein